MDRRRRLPVEPGFRGSRQPSRRAGARRATGRGEGWTPFEFDDDRRAPPASGGGAADREQPCGRSTFECLQGTRAPVGGRGCAQLRVRALERQYWDWRTPRPALFCNGGKQRRNSKSSPASTGRPKPARSPSSMRTARFSANGRSPATAKAWPRWPTGFSGAAPAAGPPPPSRSRTARRRTPFSSAASRRSRSTPSSSTASATGSPPPEPRTTGGTPASRPARSPLT